ncbi:unnamed protein product [Rangifer tarandus platyrhynchus]|uniref:Uncharacterized protein n=1 Tax=Rangifer tarandus platyrhynchus TaxID=3082113 RepID=A0ABN8YCI6_RANTA|nr:unnamed protein product [Rangifer tarandus platyrhynchus]
MHLKPPWAPSVTEIAACEVTGTLMHSRQCRKDATPLAAPKNEATLPERWQEAGLEEARLFSPRMPCLRWGASRSPGQSRAAGTRKRPPGAGCRACSLQLGAP